MALIITVSVLIYAHAYHSGWTRKSTFLYEFKLKGQEKPETFQILSSNRRSADRSLRSLLEHKTDGDKTQIEYSKFKKVLSTTVQYVKNLKLYETS